MTTATTKPAVRSPEGLAACRAVHPDAKRATVERGNLRDDVKAISGTIVQVSGAPCRVLRVAREDIGASWGSPGEYGYRLHLIVSAAAAKS